ncbi:hypothetical protein [uncultured Actinomyces sp.]|uniref:hypothetical protein n=1 Tax=uncultured Actinomyces sp. TaxID=249061 RepID=UPI00261DCAC3|nr:hypothetical protein [uncultured Actinomyces sp.]
MPAPGNALLVLLVSPFSPYLDARPTDLRKNCGDEDSEDERDEGMVLPQVVQWTDPVEPRLT